MKFRKQNDIIVDGVRPGFTTRNSFSLRTDHTPKIQIFAYSEDDEEEEPEERTYWCAMCKSRLEYLKGSDTIWRCDNCMEFYDTKIQDSVVKDKEDFKLAPYSGLQHYPVFDADDPNIPFVEGINLDDKEDNPETRTYENQRIQRIHVKGSFADAIIKGALTSKTSRKDDDS